MGCFKITWNIFNLIYSISAVVVAFEPQSLPLQILSLLLFTTHLLFTISLNGLTSKEESESHTFECYMLLENCLVLLLTALLLIFTADSYLLFYALPFLCYVSILHIVCLCIACLSKNGYQFLQGFCQKKCCWRRCECTEGNSSLYRKCSKLEHCLTVMITCSCCCKPKPKLKRRATTFILKEQLSRNLPRSSISSKGSVNSMMSQMKRKSRKRSSDVLSSLKSKKKDRRSSEQSVNKINLITPDRREKRLQDLERVSPDKNSLIDSSFTTLPVREEFGSIQSLNLMGSSPYYQANEVQSPKRGQQEDAQQQCTICLQAIQKQSHVAVVPECKHMFHAHCLRLYAKEQGQRVCARCDTQYTIIWYAVSQT